MKTVYITICLFCTLVCVAQDDPISKKILDNLPVKLKTYPALSVTFSATIKQQQDQSESTYQGQLWLKGNKYKLELPNNVIYADEKKIYQYMPDVNEVNISLPSNDDSDEELQLLNPQTIFNFSSKGFKSKFVKESTQDNRKVSEIDLYPIQIKTSKYSRIRLCIEKETLQIVSIKAFFKDGTHYTISLNKYVSTSLSDSFFTFNTLQHPGVEVIDLTF